MKNALLVLASILFLSSCAILRNAPVAKTFQERLKDFPASSISLKLKHASSRVYFNANMIPYIVTQNDEDAALLLGVTHVYLRAFQMELIRYASQGRLSELMGPLARDLDHALRIFDFSKQSQEIIAKWPAETKLWMESYLTGINLGILHSREPFEYKSLGIRPTPWTMPELVTMTRLLSADVNWFAFIKSLRAKDSESTWTREKISSKEEKDLIILEELLMSLSKSGSNTWVLASKHSQSGSPLMANDPHVGIFYPNLWFLYGLHSPRFKVVGMGLVGVPFVLLGRNAHIAWGGTNMRALSTEFYDVSTLPSEAFQERKEKIKVRWWRDREITIRDSDWGPVLSDSKIFNGKEPFAVKWVGHEWSDELTTFYKLNKAQNFHDFRESFENYGVSAQNFLYADTKGNIGHVLAMRKPKRNITREDYGPLLPIEENFKWKGFTKSTELPFAYNPQEGFLVSANNRPSFAPQDLGLFFSPPDRHNRIWSLFKDTLQSKGKLSVDDMKVWQSDVYSHDAYLLKNLILARWDLSNLLTIADFEIFQSWDGNFEASSRGALVYACAEYALIQALTHKTNHKTHYKTQEFLESSSWSRILLRGWVGQEGERVVNKSRFYEALKDCAQSDLKKFKHWGDKHSVTLAHPFSNIPIVGSSYELYKTPSSGSFDTLMKRAHSLGLGKTPTTYGATARHISDLSDPDANYFVLYGGQDGYLRSEVGMDQALLWDKDEWIQMPLAIEKALVTFRFSAFASQEL